MDNMTDLNSQLFFLIYYLDSQLVCLTTQDIISIL